MNKGISSFDILREMEKRGMPVEENWRGQDKISIVFNRFEFEAVKDELEYPLKNKWDFIDGIGTRYTVGPKAGTEADFIVLRNGMGEYRFIHQTGQDEPMITQAELLERFGIDYRHFPEPQPVKVTFSPDVETVITMSSGSGFGVERTGTIETLDFKKRISEVFEKCPMPDREQILRGIWQEDQEPTEPIEITATLNFKTGEGLEEQSATP